jgi:DNA-binding CsgD family transcriptional regulator
MARIGRDQFMRLRKRYRTDKAIAELFGISRQAVYKLRTKYGIEPAAKRTAKRNAEIAYLYGLGMSSERLARRFKLSIVHIYRILKSEGVQTRRSSQRKPTDGPSNTQ